ncbi:hypothetical protein TNCV_2386851 [Trichonephila clavipes]|nr:hypothetical protein TNCV_2386851 [Trichonephila clavipes]
MPKMACEISLVSNFSLKDEPRSRSSLDASNEVLRKMIRINPTLIFTEASFKLEIPQTTALDYINRLGFVSKHSVWVPHELSETNFPDGTSICSSNFARQKREPFSDHLMTGDEKWSVYKHIAL